ncbi:MAG: IclR family transcriptional regulator [Candidatus Rokubacteria bacterium]|nr:IclR family transcriptional regulator [Candidatus Rokubacteria bacterium]
MPPVRAVERAVSILTALSAEDLRLVDLAERLDLHKATVIRLLASLMDAGLVERGAFERIRAATGETVTVHVRVGTDRVCVDELESPQAIAYRAGVGQRAPMHIGSAGKVLLAFLPDGERLALLRQLRLVRITERSITSLDRLEAELAQVRRLGYAFSSGERVIGASAVSVPVLDAEDHVVAAVSVLAPAPRLVGREQARCVEILKREVPRVPLSFWSTRPARNGRAAEPQRWTSAGS